MNHFADASNMAEPGNKERTRLNGSRFPASMTAVFPLAPNFFTPVFAASQAGNHF